MEYDCKIITDASFCHRTKACAYAAWIQTGDHVQHLVDNIQANSINVAERLAIIKALKVARNRGLLKVLVLTDSQNAILKLSTGRHAVPSGFTAIHLRHIKGHSSKKHMDENSLAQRWCHQAAKERMQRGRSKTQKVKDAPASRLDIYK